jgi:hypothetical protein
VHNKSILRPCVGFSIALVAMTAAPACVRVKVDTVKIDATFTIKMEKELDDFFNTLDSSSKTLDVGKEDSIKTDKDKS